MPLYIRQPMANVIELKMCDFYPSWESSPQISHKETQIQFSNYSGKSACTQRKLLFPGVIFLPVSATLFLLANKLPQYEDDHDLMTSCTVYSHITTSLLVRWVHLFPQPPRQISLYIRPFENVSHPVQFGPVIAKSSAERCIIAFCRNECEEMNYFSPLHSTCPSPSKPGLHLQTYSAGRLQHSAFSTHLAASSGIVHSSISENKTIN